MALLAGVLAAALGAPPAGAEAANRIIARVNDRIATLYDFEVRLEESLRRAEDMPENLGARQDYVSELAREVMKELFEELLVLSRADQLAITVTASEVTEALNRMREANGLQDDEQFRAALAQSGLTPEQLRSQFEQQMRFQRVIGREVYSAVRLEEEDLRRYYRDHLEEFRQPEQVKLREIVVLDEAGGPAAAESTAAGLAAELGAGKPLEEVVAALPPGTVSEVIELGWVESGDLDAALEDAAWGLAPGTWSEPTRGRGGVHLAQMVERKESVIPTFKDVEGEIRAREERARVNERLKTYLAELEDKSYLYLDPPPQAAGFRTASGETPLSVEFPLVARDAAGAAPAPETAAAAAGEADAADAAAREAAVEAAAAEAETESLETGSAADSDAEEAVEQEIEDDLRQVQEEEIDLKPLPEEAPEPDLPDGLPPVPPR